MIKTSVSRLNDGMRTFTTVLALLAVVILYNSNLYAQFTPQSNFLRSDTSRAQRFSPRARSRLTPTTLVDSTLSLAGEWDWGPCFAVQVIGNIAYIGNGLMFQILDISNPSAPVIIGEYDTGSLISGVAVRDSFAYVANLDGVSVLNISQPASPVKVGQSQAIDSEIMCFNYPFAYVLDSGGAVYIIDVSNPSAPRQRGSMGTSGERPPSMTLVDTLIYVSNIEVPALDIIDVANPDFPVYLNGFGLNPVSGMAGQDTLLYFSAGNILTVRSIADPVNPVKIASLTVDSVSGGGYSSIALNGNYCCFVLPPVGVFIIDISNPNAPVVKAKATPTDDYFPNSFYGKGVSINGNTICAAIECGLSILKMPTPDSLQAAGIFVTGGDTGPVALDIRSPYAYVGVGTSGLAVLDISNPASPQRVAALGLDGSEAAEVKLNGNYAYVGSAGFWVVDITNPLAPQRIKNIPVRGPIGNLIIENNRLYVYAPTDTGIYTGVLIYDVSNPADPLQLSDIREGGEGMDVHNNVLYITDFYSGLQILDVTDPQNPVQESHLFNYALNILVRDSLAYVVGGDSGFAVLNVADPSEPKILGTSSRVSIQTPYAGVALSGNHFYVSTEYLSVVDVSNPYSPNVLEYYSFAGGGVFADGSYIYIPAAYSGMQIVKDNSVTGVKSELNLPFEFELFQNYPNPFNPTTTFKFTLSQATLVNLVIYDVLGRKISTLIDGKKEPGNYQIQWNAQEYSSGAYFYRLEARGIEDRNSYFTQTKKMLVMK
jgi:hypothetical protein